MRPLPDEQQRLALLNAAQPRHPWHSCAEKRRCVVCERVFRGSSVKVRSPRRGVTRLACPKCGSEPALWVRPENPLIDRDAWADWESAMEVSMFALSEESETR